MRTFDLAIGLLMLIPMSALAQDEVNSFDVQTGSNGTRLAGELMYHRKVFLGSINSTGQMTLGFGYALANDTPRLTIAAAQMPRGAAVNRLYLTPSVVWQGDQDGPDALEGRIRFEWMVDNRQKYSKRRYFPVLFSLEPGWLFQFGRATSQHNIFRITLYSSRQSSRHWGVEYIQDVWPPNQAIASNFRKPGRQYFYPPSRPQPRVQLKEVWFVAWNIPTGYLRLSADKGALIQALNSTAGYGRAPSGVDWSLQYVYRRSK